MKTTTDKDAILEHEAIIKSVYDIDQNLNLSKTVVASALQNVLEDAAIFKALKLKPEEVDDWVVTMTRRLRNITHATGHSLAKKSPPSWIAQFDWLKKDGTKSSGKIGTPSKPPKADKAQVHHRCTR
jgi:hypothetical protein